MEKRNTMSEADRLVYIEGLRRYQKQGVRIFIDGEEAGEGLWERLFEVQEDGGFYMGDYILEEDRTERGLVAEKRELYGRRRGKGKLKEIRFDKVYHK